MSNPRQHLVDSNEAAADVYEAMRDVEAALYTRVVPEATRRAHNDRVDADMERMLREAGW
jgi:hypothetical protein